MKTFVRIGLVAALCMAGTAAYSQEPVKSNPKAPKVHTEKAGSRKETPATPPATSKPATKTKPATATRPKTVPKAEPAKKVDFAPTK